MLGDHPEIATRSLFQRIEARLEITDLGSELTIALGKLVIRAALRRHRPLQPVDPAHAILR